MRHHLPVAVIIRRREGGDSAGEAHRRHQRPPRPRLRERRSCPRAGARSAPTLCERSPLAPIWDVHRRCRLIPKREVSAGAAAVPVCLGPSNLQAPSQQWAGRRLLPGRSAEWRRKQRHERHRSCGVGHRAHCCALPQSRGRFAQTTMAAQHTFSAARVGAWRALLPLLLLLVALSRCVDGLSYSFTGSGCQFTSSNLVNTPFQLNGDSQIASSCLQLTTTANTQPQASR